MPFYTHIGGMFDCKTPTRFSQICRRSSAYIPQLRWSPIVPTLEECLAYTIAPPTNKVHHPTSYPWHPLLDRASMHHPLQWDTTIPSPCPCDPWYPIFGPCEYVSPAPMRYQSPFPLFYWPALNLPNTNGCQVALCLLMSYATWTLPCHMNIR